MHELFLKMKGEKMKTAFIVICIIIFVFSALAKIHEYAEMKKLKDQIKDNAERNKRPASNFIFSDEEHR